MKLQAARDAGMRRVLLPRANESEAQVRVDGELQLLYVEHIKEIPARMHEVGVVNERSFDGRVRQARATLSLHGLSLKEEKSTQNARQLIVTDAAGKAILNVFSGAKGKLTAAGPPGPTRERVQQLIDSLSLAAPQEKRDPHGFMLADEHRQMQLKDAMEQGGAERREVTGTGEQWRTVARGASDEITLWSSGKGRLTGSAPRLRRDSRLARLGPAGPCEHRGEAEEQRTEGGEQSGGAAERGTVDRHGQVREAADYSGRSSALRSIPMSASPTSFRS